MVTPFQNGWLGADSDNSVQIGAFESLWTFGDTYVGKNRANFSMPRNTIGVSSCNPATGQSTMQYFWKKKNGVPSDYFPASDNSWYWITDSALISGTPYLALQRMTNTGARGAWAFSYANTSLARILNLEAPASSWNVDYFPLNSDSQSAVELGAAMAVDSDFLLLYSQNTTVKLPEPSPVYLARIPLSALPVNQTSKLSAAMQYYARDGSWKPGLPNAADAMEVLSNGPTEFTVRFHPTIKKWIAVMGLPFSNQVYAQEAARPEGPWSAPISIYAYPEMNPEKPEYLRDTFCYAVKEHPEYSPDDSTVAFTYACNNADRGVVATHPNLYRPVPVKVPVP